MDIGSLLIVVCVAGQVGGTRPPESPSATGASADAASAPLEPVGKAATPTPAESILLTEQTLPPEAGIAGQPLALVDALSAAPDRTSQLEVIRAYWNLAAAAGDAHVAWDELELLERLKPAGLESADSAASGALLVRLPAARAQLRESLSRLAAAQQQLLRAARMPSNSAPPLATDVPHAGVYRTVVDQVYPGMQPPAAAIRADRLLPMQWAVIEARAEAVAAARDWANAVEEKHYQGGADVEQTLDAADQLASQRVGLIGAARDYNIEIAEYALGIPARLSSARDVVGLLITGRSRVDPAIILAAAESSPNEDAAVERAGHEEPSRADPRLSDPGAAGDAPVPGHGDIDLSPSSDATPRETRRPIDGEGGVPDAAASPPQSANGSYAGLVGMPGGRQAQHLAEALHWQAADETENGAEVLLSDALSRAPAEVRGDLVDSYWFARDLAARRASLEHQQERIAMLLAATLEDTTPSAGDALLRLHAAEAAVKAAALQAEADEWAERYRLNALVGRAAGDTWARPATAPHGGGYMTKLERQPLSVRENPDVQTLSRSTVALHEALADRAAAVVAADAAAALSIDDWQRGAAPIEPALNAIEEQSTQTLGFLSTLRDYNRTIGRYVVAALPSSTPTHTLARAMVLREHAQ